MRAAVEMDTLPTLLPPKVIGTSRYVLPGSSVLRDKLRTHPRAARRDVT
jgi:hypothetical protein